MFEVYKVSYYDAGDDLRQPLSLYLKVENADSLRSNRSLVLKWLSRRESKDYRPNTFNKELELQKLKPSKDWTPFSCYHTTEDAFEVNNHGVIRTKVQVPKESV